LELQVNIVAPKFLKKPRFLSSVLFQYLALALRITTYSKMAIGTPAITNDFQTKSEEGNQKDKSNIQQNSFLLINF
jgi:hypothetical protein